MSEFVDLPLLSEPPLVEVVYSLQVNTAPDLVQEVVVEGVKKALGATWKVELVDRVHVKVQARAGTIPEQEQQMDWQGLKCTAADGRQAIHMMREGLFVNFLPPYKGFPECIREVQRIWALYTEFFRPQRVVRTGIRYINLLQIPLVNGEVQFATYFKFLTLYPLEGPFHLHRFHHQFEVSEPEFNLPARVIFTSMKETQHTLDVVLDIETFDDQLRTPVEALLWPGFDRLRHWAYKLFTNTLTQECFQRYQ
jgi:uncharacterized protein (TIGR04255 family)